MSACECLSDPPTSTHFRERRSIHLASRWSGKGLRFGFHFRVSRVDVSEHLRTGSQRPRAILRLRASLKCQRIRTARTGGGRTAVEMLHASSSGNRAS